jgi:hypothetical protein
MIFQGALKDNFAGIESYLKKLISLEIFNFFAFNISEFIPLSYFLRTRKDGCIIGSYSRFNLSLKGF